MFKEFKGTGLIDFTERFRTDDDCRAYLSHYKWGQGFSCDRCGRSAYWPKKGSPYHRVCKSCRHTCSVTANTLFHKLKFGLRKAFCMLFELSSTTKGMSAEMLALRYSVNRKTALLFTKKVRLAMSSSRSWPMEGLCEVDEAVIGGKEEGKRGRGAAKKKKLSVAIETDGKKGIKRAYCQQIADFSARELGKIFRAHISPGARVLTDEWTGYLPLMGDWDIERQKSQPKKNFTLMHRFIQQLKGWIRGIHHHVGQKYLQGYLDEYCFRFNRNGNKGGIFDIIVQRMVRHRPVYKVNINYQ